MSRAIVTKQYKDFTGGLDTDSSYLNMKENTVVDIDGFILDKSGKVYRSRWDYESTDGFDSTLSVTDIFPIDTYVWHAPNGNADIDLLVVRQKDIINFFNIDKFDPSSIVLDNVISTPLDLTVTFYDASTAHDSHMQFAAGNGKLFLACDGMYPTYVTWDGSTAFVGHYSDLRVRDFTGVDDGLETNTQPVYTGDQFFWLAGTSGTFQVAETVTGSTTGAAAGTVVSWDATNKILRVTTSVKWTLGETITGDTSTATGWLNLYSPVMDDFPTNNHLYNLINQGWNSTQITQYTLTGTEPSNSQVWYLGKDTSDVFSPALLDKQGFGNSKAFRGSMTISPFLRDRENARLFGWNGEYDNIFTVGGSGSVDTLSESKSPTTVAFAFGRVWWSGANTANNTGKVWFSQVLLDNIENFNDCYQAQDPTAEDFNSVLDTDGGEISIYEIGSISKLVPYKSGILVFGSNGVWLISSPDTGFTATSYSVSKISDDGVLGYKTIVRAEDSIFYWSRLGVMMIGIDPQTGTIVTKNISQGKINNFYLNRECRVPDGKISFEAKYNANAAYDEVNNRVVWIYSRTSVYGDLGNSALILDLNLGCFYRLTLPVNTRSIFYRDGHGLRMLSRGTVGSDLYYYCYKLEGDQFTSSSYLQTFFETVGDVVRSKNVTSLIFQFERTEDGFELDGSGDLVFTNPSACNLETRWEWTNRTETNRWSSTSNVYRLPVQYNPTGVSDPFNYGYTVITTKNRIRGNGRALSYRLTSIDDNDIVLLGWTAIYTAGGAI